MDHVPASTHRTAHDPRPAALRGQPFQRSELAFGHGTDNAYDEAAYLVLHTLHLPLDRLEPFLDARLTRSEVGRVLDVVERRVGNAFPPPI